MVRHKRPRAAIRKHAAVFSALGDETRLMLLERLSDGEARSIARLSEGCAITRQAVTKHLRVLEEAGLVRGVRHGRENRFVLHHQRLNDARLALDGIARQWEAALQRLKGFVESDD